MKWVALLTTIAITLTACTPLSEETLARRERVRAYTGPGMRSLCQDPALLWPCPELNEPDESQEQATREALRR